MNTRTVLSFFVAVSLCGSVKGQSLLLEQGQAAPFVQVGYTHTNLSDYDIKSNGGEVHIGYAFSPKADVGFCAGYSRASTKSRSRISMSSNSTMVGQFIDYYPVRFKAKKREFAFGLHESYMAALSAVGDPVVSGIVSVNTITRPDHNSVGTSLSLGLGGMRPIGESDIEFCWLGEVCTFWSNTWFRPMGLIFEFIKTERTIGFAVGMTLAFCR